MNRFLGWFTQNTTAQEDIKVFFEETVSECFQKCVKTTKSPLSKQETQCIVKCARSKLELIQEIDKIIDKTLQEIKHSSK
ncbi:hypothetical protein NEOKW01_1323 [Nematocida sp. AWRm80]|nr:hypothetical protein NEOKW01_1323 [Nematocida sp. AWRm80]